MLQNGYKARISFASVSLSHAEHSWCQARKGLAAGEAGNEKMSLTAMKTDATREFLRRKGVVLT